MQEDCDESNLSILILKYYSDYYYRIIKISIASVTKIWFQQKDKFKFFRLLFSQNILFQLTSNIIHINFINEFKQLVQLIQLNFLKIIFICKRASFLKLQHYSVANLTINRQPNLADLIFNRLIYK